MFIEPILSGRVEAHALAGAFNVYGRLRRKSARRPSVLSQFSSRPLLTTKGENVMTLDIPGVFMQVDIDDLVHIK